VTTRDFFVRATGYAGFQLTRMSERLRAGGMSLGGESGAASGQRTLIGERDIEWPWTLVHMHRGPGRVLDFGSGNGMMALGASLSGNDAVAVDLEPEQYLFRGHDIEYVQGDFNQLDFDAGSFDQILNCSSIEHVGLAGRYGSPDESDGDLRAMEKMADLLKPSGDMVLAIPVGLDAVYVPWHRVYGEELLPRLLDRWSSQKESYWAKFTGDRYEPVSREHALRDQGSAGYYALGLYVVIPR
jgi:SAM-dependent methyltransferase